MIRALLAASFKAAMKIEKKNEREKKKRTNKKGFVVPTCAGSSTEKGLSRGAAPLQSGFGAGADGVMPIEGMRLELDQAQYGPNRCGEDMAAAKL